MEILLSSAARREEIVLAKVFTAATICFTTALLSAASLMFGLRHLTGGNRPGSPIPADLPVDGPTVALLLLSLMPLTVLVSSIAVALAAGARSAREGMSYAMPVLFIALGVGMSSFLPDFETKQVLDIVPFASFTRMIKQIMLGDWSWSGAFANLIAERVSANAAEQPFADLDTSPRNRNTPRNQVDRRGYGTAPATANRFGVREASFLPAGAQVPHSRSEDPRACFAGRRARDRPSAKLPDYLQSPLQAMRSESTDCLMCHSDGHLPYRATCGRRS
jgi:hypothetical protein